MLVDDDQTTNFLNQLLLKKLAITDQILVAQDGQAALELLEQHCMTLTSTCPSLILLDVNMPGMNGIQFLEAFQQLSIAQQHTIIIVMLTTSLHPRDVERVQQLHINGFLNKPLTREKINDLLRTHFQSELPS